MFFKLVFVVNIGISTRKYNYVTSLRSVILC